jgi:hypothetical protein
MHPTERVRVCLFLTAVNLQEGARRAGGRIVGRFSPVMALPQMFPLATTLPSEVVNALARWCVSKTCSFVQGNNTKGYYRPAAFDVDYGEPVDAFCEETAPNSGVFTREWSKVRAARPPQTGPTFAKSQRELAKS